MSTAWTITMDCAEPAVLAAFWKTALGYVDAPAPTGFASWEEWFVACEVPESEWGDGAALVDPDDASTRVSFLKVPEGKSAKNRVHLDLHVTGGRAQPSDHRRAVIEATVARLTAAGASVLRENRIGGNLDGMVMADPEGNEFCVV